MTPKPDIQDEAIYRFTRPNGTPREGDIRAGECYWRAHAWWVIGQVVGTGKQITVRVKHIIGRVRG